MSLTVRDLEKIQAHLPPKYEDYQLELHDGTIVMMEPSDLVSSEISVRFSTFLFAWIEPRKLGRLFDSSGGFILPNGDLRALDVSFVFAERLRQSPRDFGELVPDLVVEIKSWTDRVKTIQAKIQMFLELGARVGILIDPDKETVTIYRSGGEAIELNNENILTIPELFPGWELNVSQLWPPVFE